MELLAFKTELRTYFGLSVAQVDEMEVNWNNYYNNNAKTINSMIPTQPDYRNTQGVAYWQWATGYYTKVDTPSEPSIALVSNTVTGYPEIGYFKNYYMLPNINDANKLIFNDVQLYNNMSDPYSNYEYLFNLTNAEGNDPDSSSFFNI